MDRSGKNLRVPNEDQNRLLILGHSETNGSDNSVCTSKYTWLTFFPVALREQFRRVGNVYFLTIGIIMFIGAYTSAWESSLTPWTTLGPLAIVIAVSLLQEGYADVARHRNDTKTNTHPCILMKRADDIGDSASRDETVFHGKDLEINLDTRHRRDSQEENKQSLPSSYKTDVAIDVTKSNAMKLAFQRVQRKDIYAGDIVLVKSREMVPADIILLASSNQGGSAYIETSSIDGETNLKLRSSPRLPEDLALGSSRRNVNLLHETETLEQASKRVVRLTLLGHPGAKNAMENPFNTVEENKADAVESYNLSKKSSRFKGIFTSQKKSMAYRGSISGSLARRRSKIDDETYVAALVSEPPNPHVNTYTGKLTLPPPEPGMPSVTIPLNNENILLRGAVLRNTEWAIGVACFTGDDTKLVMNSFETPSKFSNLDKLINRTVYIILFVMFLCVVAMATGAAITDGNKLDTYWIFGINENTNTSWPYLPDLPPPDWDTGTQNFIQNFFLFITLLNNFVPLSLYVTVEIVTFCMMFLINVDKDMYHAQTDTPASARSTIVTDLGRVSYIFSDKTGTLTRNVMRFKRCSVDGMAFGLPMERSSPQALQEKKEREENMEEVDSNISSKAFHPLKQLLVGNVYVPSPKSSDAEGDVEVAGQKTLTFNAEMFLRVMSLCHTVVVEKEHDPNSLGNVDESEKKSNSKKDRSAWKKMKKLAGSPPGSEKPSTGAPSTGAPSTGAPSTGAPSTGADGTEFKDEESVASASVASEANAGNEDLGMGADGAPSGHVYEAESPDEGALVTAASATYGFQFVGRDASGMLLKCSSPSLLQNEETAEKLKDGKLTAKTLACQTASPNIVKEGNNNADNPNSVQEEANDMAPRYEKWKVLAINKFDSDRKRMSVLVRSPPELGSLPILLCKGADSSMLDASVCEGARHLVGQEGNVEQSTVVSQNITSLESVNEENEGLIASSENWVMSNLLGIQAHLGDFASEGLRTLVLGVRILTEDECESWLEKYNFASSSIKDRSKLLTEAALSIERGLHIVGATAIEDKLQKGVPETIHSLEEAGIKLWVLTGDKRETAIEIGYSTKVLTPKMHVTEVAEGPDQRVKTLVAMEFMRLVKQGKLIDYQKASLVEPTSKGLLKCCCEPTGRFFRHISRSTRFFYYNRVKRFFRKYILCCFFKSETSQHDEDAMALIRAEEKAEELRIAPVVRRRNVRERAEKIIDDYLNSPEGELERTKKQLRQGGKNPIGPPRSPSHMRSGSLDDDDDVPGVFERAMSAKAAMDDMQKSSNKMSSSQLRSIALASMTSHQRRSSLGSAPIVDEDALSIESFVPGQKGDITSSFDRKKRTVLEKIFATDKETRHGQLNKHVKAEVKSRIASGKGDEQTIEKLAGVVEESDLQGKSLQEGYATNPQRALVIEGAALKHLLGDDVLEEMIFAVASGCDSVIACRVSPKQKALLVRLVRNYVDPTPVTLAIGDGANDVGMIQEAHVGVGISGLEGQQAVNSSDFAIAQFRYLEELLLIHGRWDFIRMSKVVLFSFYKNVVLAGNLIVFQFFALFSGTTVFDQWVLAMFNFVCFFPIVMLGLFDRDLDKDYVRRNPEVYASSRRNEHLTVRFILRWVTLVVIHVFVIYFLNYGALRREGGNTSAFDGLMGGVSRSRPGDGEGGDLKVYGTTIYNSLVVTMALKVLYETRSIILGRWPPFTCRKGVGEGWVNRLAYTWIGISWGSIGFYIFAVYMYQLVGRVSGPGSFFPFIYVTHHMFDLRSITWMLFLLVPVTASLCDVTGKVFGNLYYPTQTQIHMEIAAQEKARSNKLPKEIVAEST